MTEDQMTKLALVAELLKRDLEGALKRLAELGEPMTTKPDSISLYDEVVNG
jgi:hypothetical protein